MKRKLKFGRAMLIYAAIWCIVIVGVCAKLWNVFADYQKKYIVASEEANPDRIMDEQIKAYTSERLSSIAEEFIQEVNEYEKQENIQAALASLINGKTITYEREDNFSNRKPLYVVKADGQVISYVSMKQKNESDQFGFHNCAVENIILDTSSIPFYNVMVWAPDGSEIVINGNKVSNTYASDEEIKLSGINEKAIKLAGSKYKIRKYELCNFLQYPEVQVTVNGQPTDIIASGEGNYVANIPVDEVIGKDVSHTVLKAGEKYIFNTNQMASFEDVAKYLQKGSEAYQNVLSVQSGLTWAGKPEQLDILEDGVLEMHQYSDDVFTVKTYFKIHRIYREVTYEEEMIYEWLLVNDNSEWLIRNFSLVK